MSRPPLTVLARAVYPLHPPGGMERAVFEQLRHLAGVEQPVTLVTQPATADVPPAAPDQLAPIIQRQFVRYGDLPLRRNSIPDRLLNYPLFVARVGRLLAQQPRLAGALIHAHGLLVAAAPAGRPLVYAPHGLEEFQRVDWRKWLLYAPLRQQLRRAARRAGAVLATDAVMAPAVSAALRIPAARVRVIPNGISVAGLEALVDRARQATLAEQLHLAEADLNLITCARLEANKGLPIGLVALATLRATLPPRWRWWIVGVGSSEAALRQQIAALGLGEQVHLLGRLDDRDLHNLLPQMDLYLMPSLYEGSSLATLEAMTHRLPVVATRVGGLPDKVVESKTGYLAPPGDSAGLAAALQTALGERPQWPTLGRAGRQLVERQFDWPAIADQLRALYVELLTAAGSDRKAS